MKHNKAHENLNTRKAGCYLLFLVFILPQSALGRHLIQQDTLEVEHDSLLVENVIDLTEKTASSHPARRAWVLSAVLPGAGQIYNKKYWKAPVVWAAIATSVYFFQNNITEYTYYQNAYLDYVKEGRNISNEQTYKDLTELQEANIDWDNLTAREANYIKQYLDNNRMSYKRNRDLMAIVTLGIYFLNIIDASVDAHFFDFDVGEDLSFRWQPELVPGYNFSAHYGVRCSINF